MPADSRGGDGRWLRAASLALAAAFALAGEPSPAITVPSAPQQIHLSWERSSTDFVTVTWMTAGPSPEPRVRVGRTPSLEMGAVPARTGNVPDKPGASSHSAVLGPLPEDTRFFYLVGDDTTGWSPLHQFTTAPSAGRPLRFCAAADMGQGTTPRNNVHRMAEANPDFVLHLGDLSYAEGDPEDWDRWFRLIEPVASLAPYMTAIGNHEHEAAGLGAYLERLALPGVERFYSFDCGMLHVIVLDSGREYGDPPAGMTDWLREDLEASSRRPGRLWTVVGFHFPPFSSGIYGSWEGGRRAWSPLFDAYGVNLVLGGHMHAYERSWPVGADGTVVRKDYRQPQAPVYVVTGGAGRHGLLYEFVDPAPDWSAFRASANHTLRVDVDEHQMKVVAIRPNGAVLDAFTITRETPGP